MLKISILALGISLFSPNSFANTSDILTYLNKNMTAVNTMTSDFTQEKQMQLLQHVAISEGRLIYASPNQLRWELIEPITTGFIIKGTSGLRWNSHQVEAKEFQLAQDPMLQAVAEQLFIWVRGDFHKLQQQFEINIEAKNPITLSLWPKKNTAMPLAKIMVNFAKDDLSVAKIEFHEKDGDFTRFTYHNTKINEELPQNIFDTITYDAP